MIKKNNNRLAYAVIAGHVVEVFDATMYGFYAVLVAPYFFPPIASGFGQMFLSFAAFAAGFIARPLGAIVFGFIGDRFGRKKPLMAAMALVGIPTLIIGFLPTYEHIGMWAPVVLMICRLAQGFFYGAEFAGVTVYTYENFKTSGVLGYQVGSVISAGTLGAVLSTGLGALFTMNIMPAQFWRIPFIAGGFAAFCIYLWRRKLKETEEFEELAAKKKTLRIPFAGILNHKGSFVVAMIISSLSTVPLYLVTVYGNHLFRDLGYSASESLLFNMSVLIFDAFMIVLYGRIADRTGFRRQLLFGCFWLVIASVPSFYLLATYPSIWTIYSFMLLISTGNGIIVACTSPYTLSFFPTNCRYSAAAFSSAMGTALISGPTPAIATYMTGYFGSKVAPGFWLLLISAAAIVGIFWYETNGKKHGKLNASGLALES
jgi:MFS family permease